MTYTIDVDGLQKSFRDRPVLIGPDLRVHAGPAAVLRTRCVGA